jgi:hypothetical protein
MVAHHGITDLEDELSVLAYRGFDPLLYCARLREWLRHRQGCAHHLLGGDESKRCHISVTGKDRRNEKTFRFFRNPDSDVTGVKSYM